MVKDNTKTMQTIGLDLGDRTSQLCVLDAGGEVVEESRIPTTRAGLERRFAQELRSRVVIETGTHANWVHDLVTRAGHEVVVANARKVRAISANERKSDRVDAQMLARLGRTDPRLLCPVTVRPDEMRIDLCVLRSRAALVASRTLLVNHVRGLAKASGRRLASCSAVSLHKHEDEIPAELKSALTPVLAVLEQLAHQIVQLDKEIGRLSSERYPQTALPRQVKGVGPITGLCFVLTIGDPARFADVRDVGAYLGLVPRRDQSGGRDPELRISKTGDRMLRTLLVQSAHHILGPFGVDSDLRDFGLRLAARGGKSAKKRAVVATARKLAVLLLALLRSGAVYDPRKNRRPVTAS